MDVYTAAAVCPTTGTVVVGDAGGTVALWRDRTRAVFASGAGSPVVALNISMQAERVVVLNSAGTASLINLKSGEVVLHLPFEASEIPPAVTQLHLRASPDGSISQYQWSAPVSLTGNRLFAFIPGPDGRLIDLRAARLLSRFPCPPTAVLSPDGRLLACPGSGPARVDLVDCHRRISRWRAGTTVVRTPVWADSMVP